MPSGLMDQVAKAIKTFGKRTGKKFGDGRNPLLLGRSLGGRLHAGHDGHGSQSWTQRRLRCAMAEAAGERFAFDAYRRLINMLVMW